MFPTCHICSSHMQRTSTAQRRGLSFPGGQIYSVAYGSSIFFDQLCSKRAIGPMPFDMTRKESLESLALRSLALYMVPVFHESTYNSHACSCFLLLFSSLREAVLGSFPRGQLNCMAHGSSTIFRLAFQQTRHRANAIQRSREDLVLVYGLQ